jgi:RHS repeat-associated protein
MIDPLGRTTSHAYDVLNRHTTLVEAHGVLGEQRTTTMAYDLVGNLLSVTRPQTYDNAAVPVRTTTSFVYDALNRRTRTIEAWNSALARTTTLTYDPADRLVQVIDPLDRRTVTAYDELNRPISVTEAVDRPEERSTFTDYDPADNVLTVTDALGRVTLARYDNLNRTEQVVEAYGISGLERTTAFVYDAADNLRRQTDPLGRATSHTYDLHNRRTRTDEAFGTPQQRSTTLLYDAADNVLSATTGVASLYAHQVTTSFAYDNLNRRTKVIEAWNVPNLRRTTTLAYDRVGNLLSVIRPQSYDGLTPSVTTTTGFVYDALNRRTRTVEAQGEAGLERTTTVSYDAADNVLAVEAPLKRITSYAYDLLNRRSAVTEAAEVPANGVAALGSGGTQLVAAADWMLDQWKGWAVTVAPGTLAAQTRRIVTNSATTLTVDSAFSGSLVGLSFQIERAERRTTTFAYDAGDNLTSVTAGQSGLADYRRELTTRFAYDNLDRRTAVTEAYGVSGLQRTTTTVYDAVDNAVQRLDPLGHVTAYVYDELDRPTAVTEAAEVHAGGSTAAGSTSTTLVTTASWTDNQWAGKAVSVSTAGGVQVRRIQSNTPTTLTIEGTWNPVPGSGVPFQILAAERRTTTFSYDAVDNLLSQTVGQSGLADYQHAVTTSYGYDARNRPTQFIESWGVTATQRTTTLLYDAADQVLEVTRPQTYDSQSPAVRTTRRFTYDALNRRTTTTEAWAVPSLQRTTTHSYDAADNLLQVEAPLNRTSSFAYDKLNRQTTAVHGFGTLEATTATMLYDAADRLTAVTTGQSSDSSYRHEATTTFAYDVLDRRTAQTEAAGVSGQQRTTTWVYDAADNVLATVDPRNHSWTVTYDALSRPTARIDPLLHTTTLTYDLVGNVTRSTDAQGFATTYAYDALYRQVKMQHPGDGTVTGTTSYVYDATDNVINVIDPLNKKTTYVYDRLNRRTQVTDPRGAVTTVSYDAADNVVQVRDAAGPSNVTAFSYDQLNRLTTQTDPGSRTTTFAYDAADRLTATTDRRARLRTFTYDALDRQKGETWLTAAGGSTVNTLTFTYDAAGNLKTAANTASTYTFTYDKLNRRLSEQQPFGLSLTFTYDATDNRTRVEDSLGGVTTSVYDDANRLTQREFGGTGQTPLRVELAWTNRDQLQTLTRYRQVAGSWQVAGSTAYTYDPAMRLSNLQHRDVGGTPFSNTTYTYDAAHRLTTETRNGVPRNYSYDPADQLTGDGPLTYGYDLVGNRNTSGYQTTTGNRLSSDGTWTYTYDNEGALIKKSQGASAETWTYGYDHNNRLLWAQKAATDGGPATATVTYTYDAFGRRVQEERWHSGEGTPTTARFAYDGGDLWADLNGSSQVQARRFFLDGTDQLFARVTAGTGALAWYATDRLGSVTDLLDAAGAVKYHFDYDGFGNSSGSGSDPSYADRYRYTAREYDADTQLQHHDWRWYDPKVGRWTGEDPIGFGARDPNLYRYVQNQATAFTDPSGLDSLLPGAVPGGHGGTAPNPLAGLPGPAVLPAPSPPGSVTAPTSPGKSFWESPFDDLSRLTPGERLQREWERWGRSATRDDSSRVPSLSPRDAAFDPKQMAYGPSLEELARSIPGFAQFPTPWANGTLSTQEQRLSVNLERIPAARVRQMMSEGLIQEHKGYAYLADVTPEGDVSVAILEPIRVEYIYRRSEPYAPPWETVERVWDPGQCRGPRENLFYRAVKYTVMPVQGDPAEAAKRFRQPESVKINVEAFLDSKSPAGAIRAWAILSGVATFAFHMVPLVSAIESFKEGRFWDGVLASVGDLAGVAVGPLAKLATVRNACKTAKGIYLTGAGIQGTIGGIRLGQGVLALTSGDFDKALAYFGEATLRLLGMSKQLYQSLKAGCFPAGTPVATEDGLRAIETIRPEERVWGLDLATGRWQLCRVLVAHRREYEGPFVAIALGQDTIESTSNHPYWVVRGEGLAERPWPGDVPLTGVIPSILGRWVEARDLRVGDVLLLKPDREAAVTGLSARWVQQEVYNLHIEQVQCYAAGTAQVLVHNTDYAPTRTPWGWRDPATGKFLSNREAWQRQVKQLREKILEVEEKLEGIERRGRPFGYGPHRTTGTESELRQLYKELADLIAAEPK